MEKPNDKLTEENNSLPEAPETTEEVSEATEATEVTEQISEAPAEKAPKKKKKGLIITGAALLVVVALVGGLLVYMLGGLNTDNLIRNMDPSELGADPGATTIVRGPSTADQAAFSQAASTSASVQVGEHEHVVLPEEVEVYIGDGSETVSTLLPGAEQIKVFALFGTDLSDLSDCNIIAAVDPVHHKIKLISIARDSYVYYSDFDINSKINHAYGWGGPAMAIKTLNENFYLNVEDYVAVNWDQMQNIVNYLHGVWVYLDKEEWEGIGSPERYPYDQWVKLYGLHARKYAGLRSIDSDFQRISRQQEILYSMFNIARNVKFSKYPSLIRYGLMMCTTSFGYSELVDLSTILLDEELELETYTFPPDDDEYAWGGFIEDVFYFVYDTDRASDEIYKIIYEELYVSGYDQEEEAETAATPTTSTSYAAVTPENQPQVRPEETDEPDIGGQSVPEDETLTPEGEPLPSVPTPTEDVVSPSTPAPEGESPAPEEDQPQAAQGDPEASPQPENPEGEADASPSPEASPDVSEAPPAPGAETTPEESASSETSPSTEPSPDNQSGGFGGLVGF